MKRIQWIFPAIAIMFVVASIVYCICKKLPESDTGMVIQAGATLALAALTWGYLTAASSAMKSASEQVETTKGVLDQARQSRIQSIRPVVTMRYKKIKDDDGIITMSTWLVNAGDGTACDINLYWNLREDIVAGQCFISPPETRRGEMLYPSALNRIAFGFPLISDNGSPELRICFHTGEASGLSTPLQIQGMRALIVYKDIEGNEYCTRIRNKMQMPDSGKVDLAKEGVQLFADTGEE